MTNAALIKAIKAHALKHYAKGWDIVIETMTDKDIKYIIGKQTNLNTALIFMWDHISRYNARRASAYDTMRDRFGVNMQSHKPNAAKKVYEYEVRIRIPKEKNASSDWLIWGYAKTKDAAIKMAKIAEKTPDWKVLEVRVIYQEWTDKWQD